MATPNFSINPLLATNTTNTFSTYSDGLVQGMADDDPVIRNLLNMGVLNSTETLPMWQGIGIYEYIPQAGTTLGSLVGRATSIASTIPLAGFSVGNQFYNGLSAPQSTVPTAQNGGAVPFYRLGSGARVRVSCSPNLAASLAGGNTNQQVSWDFNAQALTLYEATYGGSTFSAMSFSNSSTYTASIAVTTGIMTVTAITNGGVFVGQSLAGTGVGTTVVTVQQLTVTGPYGQGTWSTAGQGGVAVASTAITATGAGGVCTGTTSSAHGLVPGNFMTVQSVVSNGTNTGAFNGDWQLLPGTTGSTVYFAIPSVAPLTGGAPSTRVPPTTAIMGTVTSQGTTAAGGGALPVKILNFQIGNSLIVNYDSVNNFATWNRQGTCARILI